jgi:hypothetical protein
MKKTFGASLIIIAYLFSGCTNHAREKLIAEALNECKNKPYSVYSSGYNRDLYHLSTSSIPQPSNDTWTNANYGRPIATTELEQVIRKGLKDPYSAVVSCETPIKSWYQRGHYESDKIVRSDPHESYGCFTAEPHYGYGFLCTVNAKNGFGGYIGEIKTLYFQEGSPKTGFYELQHIEERDFHVVQ